MPLQLSPLLFPLQSNIFLTITKSFTDPATPCPKFNVRKGPPTPISLWLDHSTLTHRRWHQWQPQHTQNRWPSVKETWHAEVRLGMPHFSRYSGSKKRNCPQKHFWTTLTLAFILVAICFHILFVYRSTYTEPEHWSIQSPISCHWVAAVSQGFREIQSVYARQKLYQVHSIC